MLFENNVVFSRNQILNNELNLKPLFSALVFLLILGFVSAQQSNIKSFILGKQYLDVGKNELALAAFEDYFKDQKDKKDTLCDAFFFYAEALRKLNDYSNAKIFYQKAWQCDLGVNFPLTAFHLGLMMKNSGDYAGAVLQLENFLKIYGNNNFYRKKAEHELKVCQNIETLLKDTLAVRIELLDPAINTEYSEYNAVLSGEDSMFFCSARLVQNTDKGKLFDAFWEQKLYLSEFTAMGAKKPIPFSKQINNPKNPCLNFCIAPDKQSIYFTRKSKEFLEIWVSTRNDKDVFGKPKPLNRTVNMPKSNNTQPHFAVLENDEGIQEILYFVSDRSGGFGNYDIWYAVKKDDTFQPAENAGMAINTSGNEITPFYHAESKTLYFSSDWHAGLGGYDIFHSYGERSAFESPTNIGFPINSSVNDFYFTINEIDNDGFFTSNRPASYEKENLTCCNDIYAYEWDKNAAQKIIVTVDTVYLEAKPEKILNPRSILPITLYFDNDQPDPRSTATTTQTNFLDLLNAFLDRKELYQKEYAKGLTGAAAQKAETEIEGFFVDSLMKGYSELERFTKAITEDLFEGKTIEMTVAGYASPLNSAIYNSRLSSRRIQSLLNYLMIFQNGILKPYLNNEMENQIIIKVLPKGDTESRAFVSDNPNDAKNSIYSIAACLARRISILEYNVFEPEVKNPMPFLLLATQEFNLEKIPAKMQIIKTIEIENTGIADLTISEIKTLNPFVEISFPKEPLKPQEKSYITLNISTQYMKGKVNIPIKIECNDPEREKFIFVNIEVR